MALVNEHYHEKAVLDLLYDKVYVLDFAIQQFKFLYPLKILLRKE